MDTLLQEIDDRAALVRELREKEVEARKSREYVMADMYLAQRVTEEGRYGAAYRKHCRTRPSYVDISRSALWNTKPQSGG